MTIEKLLERLEEKDAMIRKLEQEKQADRDLLLYTLFFIVFINIVFIFA